MNVVLDHDGGVDDFGALYTLLRGELSAVVATFGCTQQLKVIQHSADFLHTCSLQPNELLFAGCSAPHSPLPRGEEVPTYFGSNGMCDVTLPSSGISPEEISRLHMLAQRIRSLGKVDYLITGPCTTIAELIREHPDLIQSHISAIYVMGAALHTSGNTGPIDPALGAPAAEYNIYLDPLSFEFTMTAAADHNIPFHLITWDECKNVIVSEQMIQSAAPQNGAEAHIRSMISSYFKMYGSDNFRIDKETGNPVPVLEICDGIVPIARNEGSNEFTSAMIKVGTSEDNHGVTRLADQGGLPVRIFKPSDYERLTHLAMMNLGLKQRG